MNVETSSEPKLIEEYEIATLGGLVMPVTIDEKAGDTFLELNDRLVIHLSSKTSMHDSTKRLPSEDITIYKQHVISINHRVREVLPLTPEQQYQFQKTVQEMTSKSVH